MGPLGELGALFNPGMRHEIEERQSKENRREEEGNARDGDLRIDLASGVAVINVHGSSGAGVRAEHADPADPPAVAEPDQPSPAGADAESRAAARTAAALRRAASRTQRKDAPADSAIAGKVVAPAKPRTGQMPSSKASRASR